MVDESVPAGEFAEITIGDWRDKILRYFGDRHLLQRATVAGRLDRSDAFYINCAPASASSERSPRTQFQRLKYFEAR